MTTYCTLIFILRICTHLYDCKADVHLCIRSYCICQHRYCIVQQILTESTGHSRRPLA